MEGSITFRKDGRYMARYYDIDGKQISLYGKSLAEVQKKLNNAIKEKKRLKKEQKEKCDYTSLKLRDFAYSWLEIFKKPTIKESTYFNIEYALKRFDHCKIFDKKTKDITFYDLNNFFVNDDSNYVFYQYMKSIFEKAAEIGIIKINPMSMIVKPKEHNIIDCTTSKREEIIFSKQDIEKIMNLVSIRNSSHKELKNDIQFCYLVKILLWTGLRISEALALTIDDLNFEKKTIRVNKQICIRTKEISTTKTMKGTRIVPMFIKTEQIFLEFIDKFGKGNERLFALDYPRVQYYLKLLSKKLGKQVKSHMFRKNFVSICTFDLKINPETIAAWVGHENTNTTKEFYTFTTDDEERKAIEKIDTYLTHTEC